MSFFPNDEQHSSLYWIIFCLMTGGLGLITMLCYKLFVQVGIHDPSNPFNRGVARFSTLHNVSCVIIYIFFIDAFIYRIGG